MRNRIPFPVWFFSLFCLCFSKPGLSQTTHVLPANQPEQDACTALTLCGNSFYTPYSYQGKGKVADLSSTPCGASTGEANSVWLKVVVATAGTIAFKISPVDPVDDYDFAVIDITNTGCSNLTNVVRCNFNSNTNPNPTGIIGLDPSSQMTSVQSGVSGNPFCSVINAAAGDTYLIMINNFGSDFLPNSLGAGFTIDFTGSSATFSQGAIPALSSVDKICSSQITLHLTTQVLCSSIASSGSDFYTTPATTITSASGLNCSGSAGYTNAITINFSTPLAAGQYTLHVQNGTDGNTLLNLCNQPLPLSATIPFTATGISNTAVNLAICRNQLPYTWNGISVTTGGNAAATYTTTSSSGCDSTVTLNLTVSDVPASTAFSATICDGQSYILPWGNEANRVGTYSHSYKNIAGCDSAVTTVTLNVDKPTTTIQDIPLCIDSSKLLTASPSSNNSYVWNTGATTATITITAPGTYTAQVTDQLGCTASDTFKVTLYPNATVTLADSTFLCEGGTKTIDAGSGFQNYLWNTSNTTEVITVNSIGNYWVNVKDVHGCPGSDTTFVASIPSPKNFLLPDTVKCFYSTIVLHPLVSFDSYLWNTGATTPDISVLDSGTYQLQVIDHNGCMGTATIQVKDSTCQEYVYTPTAFTPNGDSRNDIFRPVFKGLLVQYHFTVFNRFGRKVFESSDPGAGWNGTVNREPQASGTYIWQCSYQLYQQQPQVQRGTVVLIR